MLTADRSSTETLASAVFGTQMLPVRHPLVDKPHEQFDKAVYAAVAEVQAGQEMVRKTGGRGPIRDGAVTEIHKYW